MARERYVAIGLAPARAEWFREVARWSTSAALPLEFVKCVSAEELRARLSGGRAFSAVLLDGGHPGVDRDLLDLARTGGAAVLVVGDDRARRDWAALGATAVLPPTFGRRELADALAAHAVMIGRTEADTAVRASAIDAAPAWRGRLVAVTGPGGTGASTVAMALAQGLGADPRYAGLVVLADLALDADLAMLHDTGDVVPGVQELVEAHRSGLPSADELRALTWDMGDRGYRLVLGLRRHRDWTVLRPRTFEAALDGLRRHHRAVVADVTGDVEGEEQCGSADVEDRNLMARLTVAAADVVVVVGLPGPKGVHRLVRLIGQLVEHGVAPGRIVPVLNRAPRSPRARAALTATVASLAAASLPTGRPLPPPLPLPDRRRFDDLVLDGARLPATLATPIAAAVAATIERVEGDTARPAPDDREPVAVAPGSLGLAGDHYDDLGGEGAP